MARAVPTATVAPKGMCVRVASVFREKRCVLPAAWRTKVPAVVVVNVKTVCVPSTSSAATRCGMMCVSRCAPKTAARIAEAETPTPMRGVLLSRAPDAADVRANHAYVHWIRFVARHNGTISAWKRAARAAVETAKAVVAETPAMVVWNHPIPPAEAVPAKPVFVQWIHFVAPRHGTAFVSTNVSTNAVDVNHVSLIAATKNVATMGAAAVAAVAKPANPATAVNVR